MRRQGPSKHQWSQDGIIFFVQIMIRLAVIGATITVVSVSLAFITGTTDNLLSDYVKNDPPTLSRK